MFVHADLCVLVRVCVCADVCACMCVCGVHAFVCVCVWLNEDTAQDERQYSFKIFTVLNTRSLSCSCHQLALISPSSPKASFSTSCFSLKYCRNQSMCSCFCCTVRWGFRDRPTSTSSMKWRIGPRRGKSVIWSVRKTCWWNPTFASSFIPEFNKQICI